IHLPALFENTIMDRKATLRSSTRLKSRHPARQQHASTQQDRRWSKQVTEGSDALDLEQGIFKSNNADEIAHSLKRSAISSKRRKGTPYQSAMSMLNFYINRAGKNLPETRRATLEEAKGKLREAFGRKP
ncbi:hypothetical protein EC973_007383, partial [Apophysomyces ossiformis]